MNGSARDSGPHDVPPTPPVCPPKMRPLAAARAIPAPPQHSPDSVRLRGRRDVRMAILPFRDHLVQRQHVFHRPGRPGSGQVLAHVLQERPQGALPLQPTEGPAPGIVPLHKHGLLGTEGGRGEVRGAGESSAHVRGHAIDGKRCRVNTRERVHMFSRDENRRVQRMFITLRIEPPEMQGLHAIAPASNWEEMWQQTSRVGLEIQGRLHERNLSLCPGLSIRRGRLVQPAQL